MPGFGYQAVILAGGEDKRLYPLTNGTVKALLPVANRPLISYALRSLSEAGLKSTFVVVSGEKSAASINAWINQEYSSGPDKMQCEVIAVPEEYGTADALRAVASKITSQTFAVLSVDLLTDLPVNALVAMHTMNNALATVLLFKRKTSPTTETKPGKAPKNVDYIGLNPTREHLLFYASSPESLRDLKLPMSVIKKYGSMSINSDLADAHLYVFNRSVLGLLSSHPKLSSVRQDLLPLLTQQQFRLRPPTTQDDDGHAAEGGAGAADGAAEGTSEADGEETESEAKFVASTSLPGSNYMEMSHAVRDPKKDSSLHVYIVQPTNYCARVADVAMYGEVSREVADSNVALHLTGLRPGKPHDNIVPPSTQIGNKTTITAGCILGDNCVLGDKSSIKRSVLGHNCRLGVNVKIINSVLMDGVVVGDGCTVQNSVLCAGVAVKDKATLKDCQIGPNYSVAGGVEYKGEVLAKAPAK